MRGLWLVASMGVMACGGGSEDSDDDADPTAPDGQCGEVTEHDLHVMGIVEQGGQPVEGAEVWLEERVWHPGVEEFGRATSAADGSFAFDAIGVVSVEDCWGAALEYVIVGVRGDATGEDQVNASVFGAINDGGLEVDLSGFPLQLH